MASASASEEEAAEAVSRESLSKIGRRSDTTSDLRPRSAPPLIAYLPVPRRGISSEDSACL